MSEVKLSKISPFYLPERTFQCTEENTRVDTSNSPNMAEAVYAALTGQRRDDVARSIEMDKSECRSSEAIRNCNSITAKEFRHLVAKFVASLAVQSVRKEGQIDTEETNCHVNKQEYTKVLTGAKLMYDGIFLLIDSIESGLKSLLSPKKEVSCECVCSK